MRFKKVFIKSVCVLMILCAAFFCYGAVLGDGVYMAADEAYNPDSKKLVALTFDDGPGENTGALIDLLNEYGAKATFFVLGKNAPKYPETVKKAHDSGHLIASHTFSHPRATKLSENEFLQELRKTDDALLSCGVPAAEFYRPCYGAFTNKMISGIDKYTVTWSFDTNDWKKKNADEVAAEIVRGCRDGNIILMHDTKPYTLAALENALPQLTAQGYEFVTVKSLLLRNGNSIEQGKAYKKCRFDKKADYSVIPVSV